MSGQEVRRYPWFFVPLHVVMVLTVTVSIITGLSLRWEWWWVSNALGGHGITKWIHRGSGILFVINGVIFVFYALLGFMTKGFKEGMWLHWRDVRELFRDMKYLSGLASDRPKFDKFTYQNKLEFWAASWGIFIMTLTGLVLWFPWLFGNLIIEASFIIHRWEAIVTLIALYSLHIYRVHSLHGKPRLNMVWLTGCTSVEDLKVEHPGEYEALVAEGKISPPTVAF